MRSNLNMERRWLVGTRARFGIGCDLFTKFSLYFTMVGERWCPRSCNGCRAWRMLNSADRGNLKVSVSKAEVKICTVLATITLSVIPTQSIRTL